MIQNQAIKDKRKLSNAIGLIALYTWSGKMFKSHLDIAFLHTSIIQDLYKVKPVVSGTQDKTKVLMANSSLMQVESIAE